MGNRAVNVSLWALVAAYAAARVSQAFPEKFSVLTIVALHVVPPLVFAFIHGATVYRVRGILVFMLVCLAWGNSLENLGVLTGFPFGRYHFTDAMGPAVFHVPVLLGLAYIGIGYLSWTIGRLLIGGAQEGLSASRVFTVPLVSAFVMVAWDLSMDPIWSNLVHAWIWHDGGAWFGVPVSNFLGWYLTVYLIYQSFALYLRARPNDPHLPPRTFWKPAVAFYGVCAAGNLLVRVPSAGTIITDSAGTQWRVSAILGASALVSLFAMGAFALIAWVRACPPPADSLTDRKA